MHRDVVFTFNWVTWDGARRRGMSFAQDRLAGALLDDARLRVLVANPYRSAARRALARVLARDEPFPNSPRAHLHGPLRVRRDDPADIAAIARDYARYGRLLERAAARAGLERPAVITAHPLVAAFAPLDWAGPVTYYATDDWTGSPTYRRLWPVLEAGYERMRTRDVRVCSVSQPLLDRLAPAGSAAVVPNGIEPSEWLEPAPAPGWIAELPRPRLLYAGTLDGRLDIDALRATAEAFPHGSIVLVGDVADHAHVASLGGLPNVHVLPAVGRAELSGVVPAADACLIPHHATRLTTAMSPLKLYEYLAAGRPVVATDLPPVRGTHPHVQVVADRAGFADAVRTALAVGPMTEVERLDWIDANRWSRRHEQILALALRPADRKIASARAVDSACPSSV